MGVQEQFVKIIKTCKWHTSDDVDGRSAKRIVSASVARSAYKQSFGWHKKNNMLYDRNGNEITLAEITPLLIRVAYMKGLAVFFLSDLTVQRCFNMLKNRHPNKN